MTASLHTLFADCREIEFGLIPITAEKKEFYSLFNDQMIDLCRSLPESTRLNATNFILTYSGLSVGDELNFFRKYYTPAWSILYWIRESFEDYRGVISSSITDIAATHSMAMFLHSLDDHLNDGELSASHLLLLLRSQAWHKLISAIDAFEAHFDKGLPLSERHIDEYYKAIDDSNSPESLEQYCDQFQGQMSTGLIAPELMLRLSAAPPELSEDVLQAYCRFGIAWRLLDDIKDIEEDMLKGNHSAVYHSLPDDIQTHWDLLDRDEISRCSKRANTVYGCILDRSVIFHLITRIIEELDTAAGLAQKHRFSGLAEEFRLLLKPLRELDENIGAF